MARDVLLSEVPSVLRSDLYAVAALAGAIVVVGGNALHFPSAVTALAGAAACFVLRVAAIRYHLHLPAVRARGGGGGKPAARKDEETSALTEGKDRSWPS